MKMTDIKLCLDALMTINGSDAVIEATIKVRSDDMDITQDGDDEDYNYRVVNGKVYINDDPRW